MSNFVDSFSSTIVIPCVYPQKPLFSYKKNIKFRRDPSLSLPAEGEKVRKETGEAPFQQT